MSEPKQKNWIDDCYFILESNRPLTLEERRSFSYIIKKLESTNHHFTIDEWELIEQRIKPRQYKNPVYEQQYLFPREDEYAIRTRNGKQLVETNPDAKLTSTKSEMTRKECNEFLRMIRRNMSECVSMASEIFRRGGNRYLSNYDGTEMLRIELAQAVTDANKQSIKE